MHIFIFSSIENLTNRYHSDGGLVVIAPDITQAIEQATSDGVTFTGEEIAAVKSYRLADDAEQEVFIFPDAGCC